MAPLCKECTRMLAALPMVALRSIRQIARRGSENEAGQSRNTDPYTSLLFLHSFATTLALAFACAHTLHLEEQIRKEEEDQTQRRHILDRHSARRRRIL